MIFYQNNQYSKTYSDLLKDLSLIDHIDSSYLAENYYSFILNVIGCLVNDIDLTLVDYRNKSISIPKRLEPVVARNFHSIDDLLEGIHSSKSKIGIFSSGTTADPKLIYQSVQRLLKSVRISEEYKHSRWGFTYNPSHSAGIQVFLQAICNQATLYDLYKSSRQEILTTLAQEKITHISATPTFYRMLAPYDFKLPELQSITFNGEKSTIELLESVKQTSKNARIRNIYGSTESGPLMSSENTVFQVPKRIINSIKIENEELLLKAHLVSESVNDAEWYHTGDLVKVITEEPLTIEFVTRKTRILNVGGQNVNPQEVEEVILTHPSVQDVRVFGRSNRLIGNLVMAEVKILDGHEIREKVLIDFCKEKLAKYKVPRMIKIVDEIKAGRTGKKEI